MPITHGVDEAVREIEALAGKPGVKGIMIPTMWHEHPSYGHPSYDPVWAACADAGLVVHTHSGEADTEAYNDNMAQYMLEVAFWTHRPLWQLLLAGKFDQFPNLKYAPVECGSWWVGDLLFKTDVMFGGQNWKVKKMASRTKGLIQRLPSEYIGTNVFIGASAMSKPELRRRYVNGLDGLMWGTDYPHPEGTWPNTATRLSTDFQAIPGRGDEAAAGAQRRALLRPRRRCSRRHRGRHRPDPHRAQPGPRSPDPAQRDPRGPVLVRRLRHRMEGLTAAPSVVA